MKTKQNPVDVAVLTAKPEEYSAFYRRLRNPKKWQGTKDNPNRYAWTLGSIPGEAGKYRIALGLTQEQTNVPAAIAALATFSVFRPRYLIFMGIAGSLDPTVRKGDVFIAEYIRAYQYGRILETGGLQPYSQIQEPTDQTLRANAVAFDATRDWAKLVGEKPDGSGYPKLHLGGLAAGDAVIENAVTGYFAPVKAHDSWLRAVDMEAAGMALAVRNVRENGYATGLMVVRGISDMPGGSFPGETSAGLDSSANRDSRKEWTKFASNAAAVFLEQYIRHAFPYAPAPEAAPAQHAAGKKRWRQLDMEVFTSYRSQFVRADEIPLIHAINDETYDPAVLVPTSTLEGWWRANPFTLGMVRRAGGETVGYWQLLPLTREAFRGIVEGRLLERDILPAHVMPFRDLGAGSVYLYIAGIAARPKRQPASAAVLLDFLAFLQLISRRVGIDAISAQLVSPDALPYATYFEMRMVREEGGASTWVLDCKEEIERALRKGRQELRRLKGWVPEFSSRDLKTLVALLKR
jgi:nucleoside phosphorylase